MQGRTGKIVMVLLGVLLMLVFILPSGMQGLAGSDPVVGSIGDRDVRLSELENAGWLFDYASVSLRVPGEQGQFVPLPSDMFGPYAQLLDEEPELFLLLLEESRRQGLRMPEEEVAAFLEERDVHVLVDDPASPDSQSLRPLSEVPGQQIRQQVITAASALLDVQQNALRYLDMVKISQPVLDFHFALQHQQVALDTIVVSADAFLPDVEQPAQEAIEAHFEEYKDELAGQVTPENPFGFGYRLPDRIKFQYIILPQDAVERELARTLADQSLREREQALYRYWSGNRARFPVPPGAPATQPALYPPSTPTTAPTTAPATGPTTAPTQPAVNVSDSTIASGPGALLLREGNPEVEQFLASQTRQLTGNAREADWRAYVAVHDEVADQFFFEQTMEVDAQVRDRLRDLLLSDFRAHDLARQRPDVDEAPVTRVGVRVDDPAYLERVADYIAQETGVRPTTSSFGRDFLTGQQLAETEAVGPIAEARAGVEAAMAGQGQPLPFPTYAIGTALPLLGPEQSEQLKRRGLGLELLQPSELLTDLTGNAYYFRLTDAAEDSAPEQLETVADQIRQDLRHKAAYETALETAEEIAEAARATSLADAGTDWPHRSSGLFTPAFGPENLAAFGLADAPPAAQLAGSEAVARGVYGMLAESAATESPLEEAVGLIEIPPAFTAVVASPTQLEGTWSDEMSLALGRAGMRQQLAQQSLHQSGALDEFFEEENVEDRLNWQARGDG